jgi:hypothetical protein
MLYGREKLEEKKKKKEIVNKEYEYKIIYGKLFYYEIYSENKMYRKIIEISPILKRYFFL